MGEENITASLEFADGNCGYMSRRRDCDGDWDSYCCKSGECSHKRCVVDCDGDIISLCDK